MRKVSQEEIIQFCHDNSVIDFLGVKVVPISESEVQLEVSVKNSHSNPYGMLHGGVMTTMLDTAMGAACFARNRKVVTVSMTMEFMKSVPLNSTVRTNTKILHEGRQIFICEGTLRDEKGELYAKASATFFAIESVG